MKKLSLFIFVLSFLFIFLFVPKSVLAAPCDALISINVNPPFTRVDQNISIRGQLKECPKDQRVRVYAENPNDPQKTAFSRETTTTDTGEFFIVDALFPEGGIWSLQVISDAGVMNTGETVRVENILNTQGTPIPTNTPTPAAPTAIPTPQPTPPCAQGSWRDGKCTAFQTAIGTIDTEPMGFIKRIFGLLLGLSGGVAVVLIILGGYQLMTSQGNKEAVQGARDRITSAIVGLLFLIFSLVILQIIGVDILSIPGLSAR